MKLKVLLLAFLMISALSNSIQAQSEEAQQLLLDVAKLVELKKILTDLKKGYDIVSKGYNTIKDISQGSFNLHKTFLDGLMEVSPVVRNYNRVADIINYQLLIMKEYRNAFNRFRMDSNFSDDEITYISQVYSNLFNESVKSLDALTTIITANKLRMSDDERLEAIDRLFDDMQDKLAFLRSFNNNTTILALQRAKERNDVQTMRSLYGINK